MSLQSLRVFSLRAALIAMPALLVGCSGNAAPSSTAGLSSALSAAGPLLNSLSGAVPGLSQAQAILGAGSLLGLAKAKMPTDQFSQIAGAIPGADALVGEAVSKGLPSSLSGLSDITSFLGGSGITPDQITKMIPVLTNAVKGKVSPELATGLLSALQ